MTTTYRNVEISVVSSVLGHIAFYNVNGKSGKTNTCLSAEAAVAEAKTKIDAALDVRKGRRVKA